MNSKVTKFYETAIKNEIKYNRNRYLSKYDISGKKVKVGEPYETEVPTTQDDAPTVKSTTQFDSAIEVSDE